MRPVGPFLPDDLDALDALLCRADAVAAMEDIFDGAREPTVIGMRHDCDNVIEPAVKLAAWEAERGYRSTYYVLHTSPYWDDKPLLRRSLDQIAGCGHEIGIHSNALAESLRTGRDPGDILEDAIGELRGYGHTIRSTVAHGDPLCHDARFVNDELWAECIRPDYGDPGRTLEHDGRRLTIDRRPLCSFGLDFDANWIGRGDYLSDSGARWSQPFETVTDTFPARGQLHMLQHPDWWAEAFDYAKAAA